MADDVLVLLEKKHGVPLDTFISSPISYAEEKEDKKALEVMDTYELEHIEKMLENYFSEKTK